MESENRVVVLIDMDCFYCQVEEKLNPDLKGQPIAVVQYNPWKGGGIIAVNYVARAMGVTRHMRGDEAKAKCPEIKLPSVPCSRGKADITKYRDAGKEVAKVLQKFTSLLERASIDEAYLDITAPVEERLSTLNVHTVTTDMMPNTYTLGYGSVEEFVKDVYNCASDAIDFDYEHAKRLLVGAVIVSEIRAAVYEETGYRCSAGIAHNNILAKLVCGMNKPNKQTILPKHSIDILYKTLPVRKVKHLGGKFGDTVCQILRISNMAELQTFSEKELQNKFDEKNGTWLYNIARGVDLEPVQARFNPKSIGCCKQFRGKSALLDLETVRKWLKDLGDEIEDRLERDALESNRSPKQMVVSFSTRLHDGRDTSSSRSYNFMGEDELCGDFFSSKALELLMESCEGVRPKDGENNRKLKASIEFLGISVGKFQDHVDEKKVKKINEYFSAGSSKNANEKCKNTEKPNKTKGNGKEYILQKFLQGKYDEEKITVDTNTISENKLIVESNLDKQESFFAKILNKVPGSSIKSVDSDSLYHDKPNTPLCEVIDCGEESADTEYSASTIDMEINKSIALFEEDPKEIDRIDNIRQLLNSSARNIQEASEPGDGNIIHDSNIQEAILTSNKDPDSFQYEVETIKCTECDKSIPIHMVETHADYHLALKLREEERRQVRNDRGKKVTICEDKKRKKPAAVQNKVKKRSTGGEQSSSSITNFLVKLDVTVPADTCTECGKRIPIEKLSEHSDFHEAQKLNKLLNRKPTDLLPGGTVKRKRNSASPVKSLKVPNCKSIDSFFR